MVCSCVPIHAIIRLKHEDHYDIARQNVLKFDNSCLDTYSGRLVSMIQLIIYIYIYMCVYLFLYYLSYCQSLSYIITGITFHAYIIWPDSRCLLQQLHFHQLRVDLPGCTYCSINAICNYYMLDHRFRNSSKLVWKLPPFTSTTHFLIFTLYFMFMSSNRENLTHGYK